MSRPIPTTFLSVSDQKFIAEFSKSLSRMADRDVMMHVKLIDTERMFTPEGEPKPLCSHIVSIVKEAKPQLASEVDAYIEQFAELAA